MKIKEPTKAEKREEKKMVLLKSGRWVSRWGAILPVLQGANVDKILA